MTSFDGGQAALDREVDAHLATCPSCARLLAAQRAIDVRLAASVRTPSMRGDFRAALRARIARERPSAWREALPDIVHFASWGAATLLYVLVVPLDAGVVVGSGATATLLGYVALTVARTMLEDAEGRTPSPRRG